MGHAAIRGAVEAYLAASWSATPIAYDNVEFNPPVDGRYLSVTVDPGRTEVKGLGQPPLHRHEGQIVIRCMVPKGIGSAEALSMADQIAALFRHRTIGEARTRAASVSLEGGSFDDYQATVSIPFWWEET
jgi:hypothetical protein